MEYNLKNNINEEIRNDDESSIRNYAGDSKNTNVQSRGVDIVAVRRRAALTQRRYLRLLSEGLDEHVAQMLCSKQLRTIRKFKKKLRKKQELLTQPSVAPIEHIPNNSRISPREDMRRSPFRLSSRNHEKKLQFKKSIDEEIHGTKSERMGKVNHPRKRTSQYFMDHKRTHPRDYERYESTSRRMDFVDHANSSKYSYSKKGAYPGGPPQKCMGAGPSDHIMSPRSSRQDPESSNRYQKDSDIKVKIVNRRGAMTDDQMRDVHKNLLSAILSTEGNGARPKFQALIPRTGWISVSCNDKLSRNWLQLNVPMLRPWSGADLLVVSENERIATAYFPKSETESIESALRLLKIQNEGLQTELWRVLHFREDREGIFIKFSMDESSADTLYRLRGKVTLGFSNIHFNFKE